MTEQICRTILSENNIKFESVMTNGTTIEEIIKDDKKYGIMTPKNGKYFTYKVMNWEGKWISNKKIRRAVTFTWNKVEKILDLDFRETKDGEYADFKVYFKRVVDDPLLNENTLMYHYYPISDFDNEKRGVCVVNTNYTWTSDGKAIPLHIYDPKHYPDITTSTVKTFDFDATYEHEGPGHGLGLSHSPNINTKLYYNYLGMSESMFDEKTQETVKRLLAKYPKNNMKPSRLRRWINWFKATRNRR